MAPFAGKSVLITGGAGFLGSNLAHELARQGARIGILDTLDPRYGGNLFNLTGIPADVTVGDIRDADLLEKILPGTDYIFNFAAQVSYIDSANIPFEDLDVNCRGHLVLLEACRRHCPQVKIVFSSSRMVLGKILFDPMSEKHPTLPLSLYGIHKLTAEKYHLMYTRTHGIKTVVLRITNPYGIRQQIKHSKYSLPGWFLRQAMEDKTIGIFGDGEQLRDYIYVSDIVDAILSVASADGTSGELYNCGTGRSSKFKDMIETIIRVVGKGRVEYKPWPKDYERIETGDFNVDTAKIRQATGWSPKVSLEEGVRRMYEYYREHWARYVEA